MRLIQTVPPVYVLKPGDHQAGVDGDSINCKNCDHVTFLIQFAALTGDAVLTINSGATDGTKTTAETFYYRLAGGVQGAASGDVFGAESSGTTLTLTAATYANKLLAVDVPVRELTDGQPFLTLALSSAASALNASIVALLGRHRYPAYQPPSSIPTA